MFWEIEGNAWDKFRYTKEEAVILSRTLTNCKGCINCSDCSDCINCINCKTCTSCTRCRGCTGCWGDVDKNNTQGPIVERF